MKADTDRRKRRMIIRQGWGLLSDYSVPSWDTGRGAQWRSTASWHTRAGDLPCVCTSCHCDRCVLLMWLIRVTITACCIHQPCCNWFICATTHTVTSSSRTWLMELRMRVWWWIMPNHISMMRPAIKLWCNTYFWQHCFIKKYSLGNMFCSSLSGNTFKIFIYIRCCVYKSFVCQTTTDFSNYVSHNNNLWLFAERLKLSESQKCPSPDTLKETSPLCRLPHKGVKVLQMSSCKAL